MSDWKDSFQVQSESFRLGMVESSLGFYGFIKAFPHWKRVLLIAVIVAIIPAAIGVRYGTQYYIEQSFKSSLFSAHQSFLAPTAPKIGVVKIISVSPGIYAAYAEFINENLDVAATNISYRIDFFNASDQKIATVSGTTHLLANQKKYLIAPRIESSEQLKSGIVILGDLKWQKRLTLPKVDLKVPSPIVYNTTNPLELTIEGAVVNSSPYRLGAVRLQFVLYNKANQIIAVSQRDEYDLPAYARRAYKQSWPNLYSTDTTRVVVVPDTDTIDGSNLVLENSNQNSSNVLGHPRSQQ